MIQDLFNYKAVDYSRLLILKSKSLNIDAESCQVLLVMLALKDIGKKVLTPQVIAQYTMLSSERIDEIMLKLIQSHVLDRHRGQLDFKPLYRKLLEVKETKQTTKDIDLVERFEDGFGRTLSAIEVESINDFKRRGFDDEMILDALKEAVKSQKLHLNYVEGVLNNWARYGVKIKTKVVTETRDVSDEVKNFNWWD
ncbi:MAG: DnaD domain protein [Erysipelotrichaceae bacterium]|nr:DnaD domain protein [Erysipelotrichaceae bacterium]